MSKNFHLCNLFCPYRAPFFNYYLQSWGNGARTPVPGMTTSSRDYHLLLLRRAFDNAALPVTETKTQQTGALWYKGFGLSRSWFSLQRNVRA